jgi:hypothetical protein
VLLPTDHREINKFTGPHDQSYQKVSSIIRGMVHQAKDKIQARLNRMRYSVPHIKQETDLILLQLDRSYTTIRVSS